MSDAKMKAPDESAQTLSFGGEIYSMDKRGVFTVPAEAVETLKRHGFTVVGETTPAPSAEADAS